MKIIISPAKQIKLNVDFPYETLPILSDKSRQLLQCLKEFSYEELKKIWKCNDKIAVEAYENISYINLKKPSVPAILAYNGIAYQYMNPDVFSESEWTYVNKHLRILSGFYGVLRPTDGIDPYRLEMQSKLKVNNNKDLYDFWSDSLYKSIIKNTDTIINLASKEYSVTISKYLDQDIRWVDISFLVDTPDKGLKIKATWAKMARGAMVRYCAENNIETIRQLEGFTFQGYQFSKENSEANHLVFVKAEN